jgi:hypothetical protein
MTKSENLRIHDYQFACGCRLECRLLNLNLMTNLEIGKADRRTGRGGKRPSARYPPVYTRASWRDVTKNTTRVSIFLKTRNENKTKIE